MRTSYLAAVAALALLTGCTGAGGDIIDGSSGQIAQGSPCAYGPPTRHYVHNSPEALPELTSLAIDRILRCAPNIIPDQVPITVSSITDSQRLDSSSLFGNMIADFSRTRLAERNALVSEPRLRSTLLLRQDQGEMFLSRDPATLTVPHPLYSAVLTGTYAAGGDHVFVSLKLMRADNTQILAAANFVMPRGQDMELLLH